MIKGRMASYNVSQLEMAKAVGVDQSQLSKMIRGLRAITIDQLATMCHMLDLELGEVVTTAETFVSNRDWEGEPWVEPFVLDGERVVPTAQTEPEPMSAGDAAELRKSDVGLAAKKGQRK